MSKPKYITRDTMEDIDKENAIKLAEWLKKYHLGIDRAIHSNDIISKTSSDRYCDKTITVLIGYAREQGYFIGTNKNGYYYCDTENDENSAIEYLRAKVARQLETIRTLEALRLKRRQGNQQEMFGEREQVAIYGETIEEALKSKLGAVKI